MHYGGLVNVAGEVRIQINFAPEQTKGRHARSVFVNGKFRLELDVYLVSHPMQNSTDRLFYAHKKGGAEFTQEVIIISAINLPKSKIQYF